MIPLEFLNFADAPPPPPTAPYSHAVRAGDYLFVTGQLGVNPTQARLSLAASRRRRSRSCAISRPCCAAPARRSIAR